MADDTEAEALELLSAAALYDPTNLEPLGSRAFVHCGSPLKRWSQLTQEERRAWMQGAGYGYATGKAEGERIGEAKGLRRAANANRGAVLRCNRESQGTRALNRSAASFDNWADELEGKEGT